MQAIGGTGAELKLTTWGALSGVVSFNECGPRIFESKNYLTAKAL